MIKMLDVFLNNKSKGSVVFSGNTEALFKALETEDTEAIRYLYQKCSGFIAKNGKNYGLSDEEIEEVICDAIVLCLQKIKDGNYTYQGHDPVSYVIEIGKYKILNVKRNSVKHKTSELDSGIQIADIEDLNSKEDAEQVEQLLAKLDPNCQKLIRLKYLEEKKDSDIINNKLTQYTTIDALKNHRSKCMKKLVALGSIN